MTGEERARLFTAVELSSQAVAALTRWGDECLPGLAGLRRVAPAELHVTLCFLGEQPVGEIEPIARACGSAAVSTRRVLELALGESRWLPSRRPRVLAVALEDRGGALAAVQAALAEVLQRGGWLEPERRPFLGHVTVARVGRVGRVEGRSGVRSGGRRRAVPAPDPVPFRATTLTLQRSRPGPGGSRYERLAAIALGPEA